jgi:hypothetical protein
MDGTNYILFRESDDIPFQVREDSYNLRRCGQV